MLKNEKMAEVEKLLETMKGYEVIGVVSIHKMPGRQLQDIKNLLKGKAVIRVAKKSLISLAFEKSGIEGIKQLEEKLHGETAIILTSSNPFKIYKEISKIKSPASAKVGDIALNDIEIKAGPTDLAPGPAITALQKAGLKTKVDAGKIAVMTDKIVLKKGEKVNPDLVTVFAMLKMQPMEIGLNLTAVLEKGVVYDKDVLAIDDEAYSRMISEAITSMVNLSVFIGYPTKETVEIMIQKAFREMKNIGVEANLMEKDVIEDVIAKAQREANALSSTAGA
jgi:large subunit ribosomal protein L10